MMPTKCTKRVSVNKSDILMWPDDVWCFRDGLWEFKHKSDDYRIIPADSDEWHIILELN